jgi:hypothetical protein
LALTLRNYGTLLHSIGNHDKELQAFREEVGVPGARAAGDHRADGIYQESIGILLRGGQRP